MGRASTVTLLPLDRYARIMGINPAHFNQAAGANIMPADDNCSGVIYQYAWQNNDAISREDLAVVIRDAEDEIARVLGFYPAPKWISKELIDYPRPYNRRGIGYGGWSVRGQQISIKARWGKIIQPGRRTATLLGTATVAGATLAYTDPNGDTFEELATVTLTGIAATITDACEIKVYFAGKSGSPAWEIRPALSKTLSGGTFTATFDSYLFLKPDLWEALPTANRLEAISLEDPDSFVTSVQIYREYNDVTAVSATFYWENTPALDGWCCPACNGTGCASCALTEQNGCLHIRNVHTGEVVPAVATYDTEDALWEAAAWTVCREPDQVKVWYWAGDLDEGYLSGQSCEPLSDWYAQTITYLATARLERDLCACGDVWSKQKFLREDLAKSTDKESYNISLRDLDNPFGTRRGEIMAWRRIEKVAKDDQIFEGYAV